MSEFRLPELDLSESATVSRWLKRPGESIGPHEKLLEVFSERFDWDIPSPVAAILKEIVTAEGAEVGKGAVLAVLDGAAPDAGSAAPTAARAVRVSPLAARIAADRQIDLERFHGSGPAGRVNKEDVLALLHSSPEPSGEPAIQPDLQPRVDSPESSGARPPAVTTFVAVDMSHATTQRDARRFHWLQREGFALDYLPYVVVASAAALRAVPIGAGMSTPDGDARGSGIHIEVVQAGGCTLIRNADACNLVGAARRLHAVQTKPGERAPHAFVIEDHASGGALLATSLLAPGAAGLLSVGVVQKQAVAVGDALQTHPMAYLGLTYDPRVVDEGQAGKFMAELKRLLEVVSFS
jgi:pyruvate/2-oxoglutarate dehydrogenase complex dihydrolipoamide acyltransferase (E2) component